MAKTARKPVKSLARRVTVLPTPNKNLSLQVKGHRPNLHLKAREIGGTLLLETERALGRPGLRRKAVFTSTSVSSYSVDPGNPSQYVRENAAGKRTVGRLVNGQFRPITAK